MAVLKLNPSLFRKLDFFILPILKKVLAVFVHVIFYDDVIVKSSYRKLSNVYRYLGITLPQIYIHQFIPSQLRLHLKNYRTFLVGQKIIMLGTYEFVKIF